MPTAITRLTLRPNDHPLLVDFEAEIRFSANGRSAKAVVEGTIPGGPDLTLGQVTEAVLQCLASAARREPPDEAQ